MTKTPPNLNLIAGTVSASIGMAFVIFALLHAGHTQHLFTGTLPFLLIGIGLIAQGRYVAMLEGESGAKECMLSLIANMATAVSRNDDKGRKGVFVGENRQHRRAKGKRNRYA